MSDDDPAESFVEGTVEPFGDEDDESFGPETRDMEAELRERTGANPDDPEDLTEIDSETATAFWGAVIYVNIGILLIALGPVVYALRGRALVSAALVVAGIGVLLRAYMVYRRFDARDADEDANEDADDDADEDAEGDADEVADEDADEDAAD